MLKGFSTEFETVHSGIFGDPDFNSADNGRHIFGLRGESLAGFLFVGWDGAGGISGVDGISGNDCISGSGCRDAQIGRLYVCVTNHLLVCVFVCFPNMPSFGSTFEYQ